MSFEEIDTTYWRLTAGKSYRSAAVNIPLTRHTCGAPKPASTPAGSATSWPDVGGIHVLGDRAAPERPHIIRMLPHLGSGLSKGEHS